MDEAVEREERIKRLVESFEKKLRRDWKIGPQTFDEIEDQAEEIGEELKKEIVRENAESLGSGYQGTRANCLCGMRCRYVGQRRRHLIGLHGEVMISRACYHCAQCRKTFAPVDRHLDVGRGQCSRHVQALIARFCSYLPFELASREIEAVCGVALSATTVQKYGKRIGQNLAWDWSQKEQALRQGRVPSLESRPKRVYVSMDGAIIHVGGEWREAKLAAVYERAEKGLAASSYYATLSNSTVFGSKVYTLAYRNGAQHCQDVAVVADGASWIWMEASKYFPGKRQILDYYHVTEHLWAVAEARYGPQTQPGRDWMDLQKSRLLNNRVDEVIADIREWPARKLVHRDLKRKTANYLSEHRRRMQYQTFLDQGYHIGSGVIESGCKNVVKARMAGTGMRWEPNGAEAMLHLCAHWKSHKNPDFALFTGN